MQQRSLVWFCFFSSILFGSSACGTNRPLPMGIAGAGGTFGNAVGSAGSGFVGTAGTSGAAGGIAVGGGAGSGGGGISGAGAAGASGIGNGGAPVAVPTAQTACTSAAQCGGAVPACNMTQQHCGGCSSTNDCQAFGLVCDTVSGACLECLDDTTCMTGRKCRLSDHTCVRGCAANTDCRNGRTCDTQTGTCIECATDAQCMGQKCDPSSHSCVACLANTDCPQGSTCSGGDCAPSCTSSAQCAGGGGGGPRGGGGPSGVCALGLGVCVECVDNSQCGGQGYCQPDHTCGGG